MNAIDANALKHYKGETGPIENSYLDECSIEIKNVGWTLGNECPYKCAHCYSMSARRKGADMQKWMADRIVGQFVKNSIESVNLGGNEPIFTNGSNPKNTLLPYIIEALDSSRILVGLTTAGITLVHLHQHHKGVINRLNDVDISLDSPYEDEHNRNRGANLYGLAIESLKIAKDYGIPRTVVMCGMSWNFNQSHLEDLVSLARKYDAYVRINPIKTVELSHAKVKLSPHQYYAGFSLLMTLCDSIDIGEPSLAAVSGLSATRGCPCGRTSFRVHSITPEGSVPVSPCAYLHDYKAGNLLSDELSDIVRFPQFQSFRRRTQNPQAISLCGECPAVESCRGGCAAHAYLNHLLLTGRRSLFVRDPYCPREINPTQKFSYNGHRNNCAKLVHQDYLCTWIGKPKS